LDESQKENTETMKRDEIQSAALAATDGQSRVGLGLATGVGKTLVGLMYLEKHMTPLMNVLIVAPKTSIIAEWKSQADKFQKESVLATATYSTYLSMNKHNPKDFDIVVLDECHSLLFSHREFLDNYNGKILGLTGTPPKHSNSEKGIMVDEFCPIVYTYVTDDAIEANILNDYRIIVHELRLDNKNKSVKVDTKSGSFTTTEQANYGYWCGRVDTAGMGKTAQIARVMRMKAMMTYPSKEKYTKALADSIKSKCLIFANTQEQADKLCKHSYHSQNPDSADNLIAFKEGTIDKLSCVLQLSEGVNIPNLRQGIIMHAYGNERKAAQRIGRLLRLNPDETATIHILCYMDTMDEKWVKEALEGYDESKITWKNFNIVL
jgi:superfamily II DNA or RNA helicase